MISKWQRTQLFTSLVIGLAVFCLFAALVARRDGARRSTLAAGQKGNWPLLERMEQAVFDGFFHGSAAQGERCSDVVGVVVDAASVEALRMTTGFERWPWKRASWEPILAFLARGRPKAVMLDLIFSEPDRHDGMGPPVIGPRGDEIGRGDLTLVYASMGCGKVYGNYHFASPERDGKGKVLAAPPSTLSFLDYARPTLSPAVDAPAPEGADFWGGQQAPSYPEVRARLGRIRGQPFESLLHGLAGTGWIDAEADPDGALRRTALVVRHPSKPGKLWPSLPLAAMLQEGKGASRAQGSAMDLVSVDGRGRVLVRGRPLPRSTEGQYIVRWTGPMVRRYPVIPAALLVWSELKARGIPVPPEQREFLEAEEFRDKWIVLGTTFAGGTDIKATPFGGQEPGMVKHLAVLEGLARGRFMRRAPMGTLLFVLLTVCLLGAWVNQIIESPSRNVLLLFVVALAYGWISLQLFAHWDYQLDVATPLLAMLTVFTVSTVWRHFVADRGRREVRAMFGKFMSPELVRMMEENPEAVRPGGSRKQCTSFFSDLANFTTMSEALEPEELVPLINEYLALMTSDILARGGFLDKYQGDGIMAVFGIYPGAATHALDACRAALENQANVRRLQARWAAEGKPPVSVRIGLNTGPVIAGNVGSEAKMNYTVLGDSVNLAARLESANKAFGTEIMMGLNTYEAVKDQVWARELDLLAVKGKKQGVRVYELIGIKGEDELDERRQEGLALFAEGLAEYRLQRFDGALPLFGRCLDALGDDGPARTYLQRCLRYQDDPPGENWDGVFRMTTK